MAYNLPPPPPEGGDIGGGFPGLGGGLGGFGFPGFGKSLSLDYGFGWPGFFGGGFPGWGGPYVPVTPLGGLWGFKGDLIVPIVAIGVALFILLLIVLAVKFALAWKVSLLGDLAAATRPRRDTGNAPAAHLEDSNLNRLADMVSAAVYSEGCSRRILCEMGAYAREGKQYPSLIRLMELIVPQDYHDSLVLVRESAENNFDCAERYPCGAENKTSAADASNNEVDVTQGKTSGQKVTDSAPAKNSTGVDSAKNAAAGGAPVPPGTTPAPSVFGKFQRAIFNE